MGHVRTFSRELLAFHADFLPLFWFFSRKKKHVQVWDFRFFSWVKNSIFQLLKPSFYVSGREKIAIIIFFENFQRQKCFPRPIFCQLLEIFTGASLVFTGKMGKYHIFFSGAFCFFIKKHCFKMKDDDNSPWNWRFSQILLLKLIFMLIQRQKDNFKVCFLSSQNKLSVLSQLDRLLF